MSKAPVVREATTEDDEAIIALWNDVGLLRPWNDPQADIAFARSSENATLLVAKTGEQIVAAVMTGHDGHRGTVYYLASDPKRRGLGLGRLMMKEAENWLLDKGVWKVNLMVRADNEPVLGFYDSLGYRDSKVAVREKWIDETKRPATKPE